MHFMMSKLILTSYCVMCRRKLIWKPWCILCILWYVESVCCNHGDVRNRCVCGIHCCTFLIVISVLHITQCIELFFLDVKWGYLFKTKLFLFFLREQKAKSAVCLGYVAVVFYGINLESFLWNCLIFTSIHLIFTYKLFKSLWLMFTQTRIYRKGTQLLNRDKNQRNNYITVSASLLLTEESRIKFIDSITTAQISYTWAPKWEINSKLEKLKNHLKHS